MSKKGPEIRLINAKGKSIDGISASGEYGWDEINGQEIITRLVVPRVNPVDRVADVGSGWGRASMPLAVRGAKVVAIDNCPASLKEGDEIRAQAGARRATNVLADLRTLTRRQIGGGVRAVIASDALNHLEKAEADAVIDNLPDLLNRKRGGVVYVNAPSTDSMLFQKPEDCGGKRVDARTVKVWCDCSGELREENVPFFQPGEIEARLALKGGQIMGTNRLERNGDGVLNEVVAWFKPRKKGR